MSRLAEIALFSPPLWGPRLVLPFITGLGYLYYRQGARPVRLRVGQDEVRGRTSRPLSGTPSLLGGVIGPPRKFEPIAVAELRRAFSGPSREFSPTLRWRP